jgi:MerR family copper efflux transcriptional regulator
MRSTGGSPPLSIGALAERFALAPHVLRHWEAMGLLAPARDPAGRRRYGIADVTRVAVILRAKEAGLSLDAIRSLTATADPAARRNLLEGEAEALRRRIAAAQASLDLIEMRARLRPRGHHRLSALPSGCRGPRHRRGARRTAWAWPVAVTDDDRRTRRGLDEVRGEPLFYYLENK